MAGAEASPGAGPAQHVGIPVLGLAGVLLATFLSTLNGRLSTFGLNDIRGAVHAGVDEGAWITTSQTVAQMLIAPVAIWMGGVYGSRRVLFYAALAFGILSLVKPFSPNLDSVLILQFAGGIASGFFVPLTVGFIVKSTPPKTWAYGIAIYALSLELSLNISASLEGWYIDHLSWRWIFWQNVPLSAGMAACMYFSGTFEKIVSQRSRPDLFGLASCGIGLALVYAALDQGNRLDWLNSGLVVGLLLSGILIFAAFLVNEAVRPDPLFNLKAMFGPPMPQLFVLITFLRLTILSTAYAIPQFLGVVRGYRALETGQTLIWIAIPQLLVCITAALLLRRVDARFVASSGFILICAACLIVSHGLTPVWGSDQFLLSQLLQAVGQSFALTGIVFFGVLNLRLEYALTLGAVSQIARLMGGELGQAFIVTFIRKRTQTASNLIGLHVQNGSASALGRIHAYAAATARAGSPEYGTIRGAGLLRSIVHSMATTQAVIDSFVTIAAFTALAMLLLATCKAAPVGPASPRSLFSRKVASPS